MLETLANLNFAIFAYGMILNCGAEGENLWHRPFEVMNQKHTRDCNSRSTHSGMTGFGIQNECVQSDLHG
jgi:hypothetical protein